MATAVRDLEFEQLPPEIAGLDRYSKALILIRLCRPPVGQPTLPVVAGRIGATELRDALIDAAGWPLAKRWLTSSFRNTKGCGKNVHDVSLDRLRQQRSRSLSQRLCQRGVNADAE